MEASAERHRPRSSKAERRAKRSLLRNGTVTVHIRTLLMCGTVLMTLVVFQNVRMVSIVSDDASAQPRLPHKGFRNDRRDRDKSRRAFDPRRQHGRTYRHRTSSQERNGQTDSRQTNRTEGWRRNCQGENRIEEEYEEDLGEQDDVENQYHRNRDRQIIDHFFQGPSSGSRIGRSPPPLHLGSDPKPKNRTRVVVPTLLPKPIVVVGFPKAGTSSLFTFFARNGLASQHWYCCRPQDEPHLGGPELMAGCMMRNLAKNRSIMNKCGNFEAITELNGPRRKFPDPDGTSEKTGILMNDGTYDFDGPGPRIFLPQHFHIDEIHDWAPNATWVLNLRPVDEWVASVLKWGDDLPDQFANEYYKQSANATLPGNYSDFLRRIYLEHSEFIREFVRNHPSHALVEVNITDPTAGDDLARAFGLNATHWVHRNKNRKGEKRPPTYVSNLQTTKGMIVGIVGMLVGILIGFVVGWCFAVLYY